MNLWLAILLSLVPPSLQGYGATTNFTEWFNVTEFPLEQSDNVSRYTYEALNIAGSDLYPFFAHRCIRGQVYADLSAKFQSDGFVAPNRPFDSLFFVGSSYVSSWAIDTGAGLILIDAQDNPDEVEAVILPGLAAFGYSGSDIAALIITHEHADHYGGARYLQDTFGTPVYASAVAWAGMANDPIKPPGLDPPTRNETIHDGRDLTIGNTTLSFVTTPGHTPGTLSFSFPVFDHGAPHVAALYGGGGIPADVLAREDQIRSYEKFGVAAAATGADVLVANHQAQDESLVKFDLLQHRPADAANPFVLGNGAYLRYLKMMGLCVRVQAARVGQVLSI